jgi:hypothetical protein
MIPESALTIMEINREYNIVFIQDLSNEKNTISVTNDAENVLKYFRSVHPSCRVVYMDTDNEWWEICCELENSAQIKFKRWPGLVWDILKNR